MGNAAMTSIDKPGRLKWWLLLVFALLVSLEGSTPVFSSGTAGFPGNPPKPQYTEQGVEGCLACHQGDKIVLMAETAHGNLEHPHTPYSTRGCESCHGPGSFHGSRARGGVGFPALITFHPRKESKAVQTQACTDCHGKSANNPRGIEWHGSRHQAIGMTCMSCHRLHVAEAPMKDLTQQNERCSQCHGRALEQHDRFEDAGIEFRELTCATCHDVHEY